MSRKLTVILLAMLVLAGAMSLKTVVTTHGTGPVVLSANGAPVPTPWKNGAPVPTPWKNGAPVPTPWK